MITIYAVGDVDGQREEEVLFTTEAVAKEAAIDIANYGEMEELYTEANAVWVRGTPDASYLYLITEADPAQYIYIREVKVSETHGEEE
jgi:hypothetical protein